MIKYRQKSNWLREMASLTEFGRGSNLKMRKKLYKLYLQKKEMAESYWISIVAYNHASSTK
jgi:hypothetical protein